MKYSLGNRFFITGLLLIIMPMAIVFAEVKKPAQIPADAQAAVETVKTEGKTWFTTHIYMPIEIWRTDQVIVWQGMVAENSKIVLPEILQNKIPATPVATKPTDEKKSLDTKITDDIIDNFDTSREIKDVIENFNPENTIGFAYKFFLKILIFIFQTPVIFYGVGIFFVLAVLKNILRMFFTSSSTE